MKTALIICSTPYQIMVGILLKNQLFKNGEHIDIALTNTFSGVERIANNIKKTEMVREVYIIEAASLIRPSNFYEKYKKLKFMLGYSKGVDELFSGSFAGYDTVLFNCEEIVLYSLITYNRKLKPDSKVIRFEEGYSSYTDFMSASEKSRKLISIRNSFLGMGDALHIDAFAVFEPELLIHKYPYSIIQIDRSYIHSKQYKDCIAQIFETKQVVSTYNKRYIVFEESFFRDGYDIDDIELYNRLFKIIGDENVSVKLHPRSSKNRFEAFKCDVHVPEGVPWEAILLSGDFTGVCLIALASGGIINSRLLLGDKTSAFLLYKCLEKRPPALNKEFDLFLNKLLSLKKDSITVPDDRNELEELFKI